MFKFKKLISLCMVMIMVLSHTGISYVSAKENNIVWGDYEGEEVLSQMLSLIMN